MDKPVAQEGADFLGERMPNEYADDTPEWNDEG